MRKIFILYFISALNKDELEIAFELKMSLESPRVVQKLLDDLKIIQATHVSLLFDKSLCQSNKPYKWSFLANSGRDPSQTRIIIKNLILKTCDQLMEDCSSPPDVIIITYIFHCTNVAAFH